MSPQELAESGVTDGLVRISVGIEDWRDLLADFDQALA
jgi:cystathionine beta-lyase/cystathionine gamma-synthase